jgi:hypothetical protein
MAKKIQLYIISLFFLFLLLFVVKVDVPICVKGNCKFIGFLALISRNGIALFALVFMLLGVLFYLRFNYEVTKGAPRLPKKVVALKNLHSETLSFLATYIIPLACLDMDKARSLPMLVLLLTLVGWIYVKTDLFYTNPTLAILGFKIYQLDTDGTKDMIVIIRQSLQKGESILSRQINANIYYAKKAKTL